MEKDAPEPQRFSLNEERVIAGLKDFGFVVLFSVVGAVLAYLIDWNYLGNLLIVVAEKFYFSPAGLIMNLFPSGEPFVPSGEGILKFLLYLILSACSMTALVYFFVSEVVFTRSPGKRNSGLMVLGPDGEAPGIIRRFLRFAVFWVLTLATPLLFVLPCIPCFFTRKRQGLHELVSGTALVDSRSATNEDVPSVPVPFDE